MLSNSLSTVALLSALISPILAAPVERDDISAANPLLAKRDCSNTGDKNIENVSMTHSARSKNGEVTILISSNDYCHFYDEYSHQESFGPHFQVLNSGDCEITLSLAKSDKFHREEDNRRSHTFYDGQTVDSCFPYSDNYDEYASAKFAGTDIYSRVIIIGSENDSLGESKAAKKKDKKEPELVVADSVKALKKQKVTLCKGEPKKGGKCEKK